MVLQGLIEFPKTRDECDTVASTTEARFGPKATTFNSAFSEASQQVCFAHTVVNAIKYCLSPDGYILHRLFDSTPLPDFVNAVGTVK